MHPLDFSLLPETKYGHSFYPINEDFKRAFQKYDEILARAEACIRFILKISHEDEIKLKEAYLRASLSELVSIEDVLRWLPGSIFKSNIYRLNCSRNPLLHILRELRNYNIHIKSNSMISHRSSVQYGNRHNPSSFDGTLSVEHNMWYVSDIEKNYFIKLYNKRFYSDNEIDAMLSWFNKSQKEWGIGDLIYKGLNSYLEEMINHYELK